MYDRLIVMLLAELVGGIAIGNGLMGITESGGRMSIRVKGYDFFLHLLGIESCQVCGTLVWLLGLQWT
jgi:hypothetical protein